MNWKVFLKPDWRKILITILILVISVCLFLFQFTSPLIFLLNAPIVGVLYPVIMTSTTGEFGLTVALFSIIINIFYWYLLSCLIVWIYNKVKKR